jgi:hypothetical protein
VGRNEIVIGWFFLKSKPISILLSVFVLAIVGLSLISVPVAASGVGAWKSTTGYPETVNVHSCVFWGNYIYCVGGFNATGSSNAVYFAPLSGTGAGAWKRTINYPTYIGEQSCAASGDGYIYCVGGTEDGVSATNAVYFASLHSSGVSAWTQTTSYPTNIDSQSCVVSGGYIYCVGGYTGSPYDTDSVYFAPVSGTGVGTWTATTSYPTNIAYQSCVVSTGGIFCVGGYFTSAVYFAPYTHSGVGAWVATTNYPTTVYGQSCVVYGGVIYCVGGYTGLYTNAVYFASASHSGVSAWKSTKNYPTAIYGESCVDRGPTVFCVGGFTNASPYFTSAVYFASV